MKFPGVRTVITFALVGATIAAMFLHIPIEEQATVTNLTIAVVAFYFGTRTPPTTAGQ